MFSHNEINEYLASLAWAERERLENLCQQALVLQDLNYLNRLVLVIGKFDVPDTVASMLEEPRVTIGDNLIRLVTRRY